MKNHHSKEKPALSNHTLNTSTKQAEINKKAYKPLEVGGPKGPEPTRYGDWEKAGRCNDF